MSTHRVGDDHLVWLGWVGPAAFFTAHIGGFASTSLGCNQRAWLEPAIFGLAAFCCIFAAIVAWIARAGHASRAGSDKRARFLGLVSTVSLAIFTIVLLWDLAATLTYSGCER